MVLRTRLRFRNRLILLVTGRKLTGFLVLTHVRSCVVFDLIRGAYVHNSEHILNSDAFWSKIFSSPITCEKAKLTLVRCLTFLTSVETAQQWIITNLTPVVNCFLVPGAYPLEQALEDLLFKY